jgi:hypothetical protein
MELREDFAAMSVVNHMQAQQALARRCLICRAFAERKVEVGWQGNAQPDPALDAWPGREQAQRQSASERLQSKLRDHDCCKEEQDIDEIACETTNEDDVRRALWFLSVHEDASSRTERAKLSPDGLYR